MTETIDQAMQRMQDEANELRRMVRIEVAPEIMLAMMKGDVHFHVAKGLPATAKFRGMTFNIAQGTLVVYASDDSFAEVKDSEDLPEFEVEWVRIEPEG